MSALRIYEEFLLPFLFDFHGLDETLSHAVGVKHLHYDTFSIRDTPGERVSELFLIHLSDLATVAWSALG